MFNPAALRRLPAATAKLAYLRVLGKQGLANGFHYGAVAAVARSPAELTAVLRAARRRPESARGAAEEGESPSAAGLAEGGAALATSAHAAWLRLGLCPQRAHFGETVILLHPFPL